MALSRVFRILWLVCGVVAGADPAAAAPIHTAPVVIQGHRIRIATHYPVAMYRLYATDESGKATQIPFQIDEINEWGDYVLPEGGNVTAKTGNGIFDLQDEIAFMGDDVGPVKRPTTWEGVKPSLVFEIKLGFDPRKGSNTAGPNQGAVYLGVFFQNPPPVTDRRYVTFRRDSAEVVTSRYRYSFDTKNWLVARRVDMIRKGSEKNPTPDFVPLLESTTFFMRADLKYFITVEANHRSINSELEAFKQGPVRSIVRISFHYNFLKLNFELGMYTEVSFFSNAVYLPAILHNPLDGAKSLNGGSGFYYGMALKENPSQFKIDSNMPPYREKGLFDIFKSGGRVEKLYWITAAGLDRMLYMEISPSQQMHATGAVPQLYREEIEGAQIANRNKETPGPLGASPVNMALYFDMTKFTEGEHIMAFRLFFENVNEQSRLTAFKNLGNWMIDAVRVRE